MIFSPNANDQILCQFQLNLSCTECPPRVTPGDDARWQKVPPGEAVPFWPRITDPEAMLMAVRVDDDSSLVTRPFLFTDTHATLLRLPKVLHNFSSLLIF